MKARLLCIAFAVASCGKTEPRASAEKTPSPDEDMESAAEPTGQPSAQGSPTGDDDPEGDDPEGDDPEGDDPEGDDPEGDDPAGEMEPPSKGAARSAASAVLGSELAVLTPTVPVGTKRFAAAWRVLDAKTPTAATAHLVIYEQSDAEGWTAPLHAELLRMDTPWLEEEQPPPMPATIKSDDYDDDGKAEILVRIEEQIMCPGAGTNTITHLSIYDQADGLTQAHRSELHHRNENGIATKGKAEHVDLDSDGHRDLRITYTTKDEHDGSTKTQVNTWLWDSKTDAYVAKQVEYEASGCDW